ncbi:hypothetical protein AB0I60_03915 [Actinosynnema sp. NPDC050436]|uniref:hypothetical protein n=1 Tax=Actinosynnema sp. NPDC050436 TaxID=3155659 RepID=UPI00340EE586
MTYAEQLHATVERLAIGLGWPLVLADGNVYLPTSRGIIGLVVPARFGGWVDAEFRRRCVAAGTVALADGTWAFLVEDPGVQDPPVPSGVLVVNGPRYLPVPPSVTGDGPVRWVREPRTDVRAVPPFRLALDVVRRLLPRRA